MKWIAVTIFGAICYNATILFFGRGSLLMAYNIIWSYLFVGLPMLAVAGVLIICSRDPSRRGVRVAGLSLFCSSLIVFSSIVYDWLGSYIAHRDMIKAQSFCESLVPIIEANKLETGNYPTNISALFHYQKVPLLIDTKNFYHSLGPNFTFSIMDQTSMFGAYYFHSDNREWRYVD